MKMKTKTKRKAHFVSYKCACVPGLNVHAMRIFYMLQKRKMASGTVYEFIIDLALLFPLNSLKIFINLFNQLVRRSFVLRKFMNPNKNRMLNGTNLVKTFARHPHNQLMSVIILVTAELVQHNLLFNEERLPEPKPSLSMKRMSIMHESAFHQPYKEFRNKLRLWLRCTFIVQWMHAIMVKDIHVCHLELYGHYSILKSTGIETTESQIFSIVCAMKAIHTIWCCMDKCKSQRGSVMEIFFNKEIFVWEFKHKRCIGLNVEFTYIVYKLNWMHSNQLSFQLHHICMQYLIKIYPNQLDLKKYASHLRYETLGHPFESNQIEWAQDYLFILPTLMWIYLVDLGSISFA